MYRGGVKSTNTINLAIVTDLDSKISNPVNGPVKSISPKMIGGQQNFSSNHQSLSNNSPGHRRRKSSAHSFGGALRTPNPKKFL